LRVRLCRQHEQEILGGQRRHGHHRLRTLRPDVDHHPGQVASHVIALLGERTRMFSREPLDDAVTQLGLGQQDRL